MVTLASSASSWRRGPSRPGVGWYRWERSSSLPHFHLARRADCCGSPEQVIKFTLRVTQIDYPQQHQFGILIAHQCRFPFALSAEEIARTIDQFGGAIDIA